MTEQGSRLFITWIGAYGRLRFIDSLIAIPVRIPRVWQMSFINIVRQLDLVHSVKSRKSIWGTGTVMPGFGRFSKSIWSPGALGETPSLAGRLRGSGQHQHLVKSTRVKNRGIGFGGDRSSRLNVARQVAPQSGVEIRFVLDAIEGLRN